MHFDFLDKDSVGLLTHAFDFLLTNTFDLLKI